MGSKHRKLIENFCEGFCNKYPEDDSCSYCKHHKSNKTFPIVASTLAAVALLVCGYFLYVRYYKNRRTRSSSQPQQPPLPDLHQHHHAEFIDEEHGPMVDHPIWYIRTVGLQQSLISSITVCQYKKGDGLVEGTECAVCLNEFQEDETLRLLPKCDHAFHVPCIDTWLTSHTNCPMCRAPIIMTGATTVPPQPPPPEPNIVDSSQPEEETQVEMLENTGESSTTGGVENEIGETRTEAGEDTIDKQICIYQEPRRRSVSIDSSSASKISLALSNVIAAESDGNSNTQIAVAEEKSNRGIEIAPKRNGGNQKLSRQKGTSSRGRSLQNGKQTLKRSSSCNGKLLLCMDIDNCDSVFPLRSF